MVYAKATNFTSHTSQKIGEQEGIPSWVRTSILSLNLLAMLAKNVGSRKEFHLGLERLLSAPIY